MHVPDSLRALILAKLADGRLPRDNTPRVCWGEPGNDETCIGCDQVITKANFVMEGVGKELRPVQFHVTCFYVWDSERGEDDHE